MESFYRQVPVSHVPGVSWSCGKGGRAMISDVVAARYDNFYNVDDMTGLTLPFFTRWACCCVSDGEE
eukprot:754913-Hanusia_phi.AAC.1